MYNYCRNLSSDNKKRTPIMCKVTHSMDIYTNNQNIVYLNLSDSLVGFFFVPEHLI